MKMTQFFGNVIAPSADRPAHLNHPERSVGGLPCEGSESRFSPNFSANISLDDWGKTACGDFLNVEPPREEQTHESL
jgi:hypothetical protein